MAWSGKLLAVSAMMMAGFHTAAMAAPAPAAFLVCTACHTVSADGGNSVGPNLHGVVGRKAGTHPGYSYSVALKSSAVVWTPDQIDRWLSGPGKMIPGVRMVQTVSNAADRQNIIAYLSTLK